MGDRYRDSGRCPRWSAPISTPACSIRGDQREHGTDRAGVGPGGVPDGDGGAGRRGQVGAQRVVEGEPRPHHRDQEAHRGDQSEDRDRATHPSACR